MLSAAHLPWQASVAPNARLSCRGRCKGVETRKTRMAAPVDCNGWIILMASCGMGREPVPRVYGLETAKLRPSVGFSGKTHFPTTMRAQAPGPMPKENHDAFLQAGPPILLRRRSARQNDVPVRLRPRRQEALAQGSPQRADRPSAAATQGDSEVR